MIILGLDISLNSPGWCRVDTETGARTFDTLHYSELKDLARIGEASRDLVDLCRQADLIVMEGLSMGLPSGPKGPFMPQGRFDLIGLTYILRLWLWKSQKSALLVSPMSLKKFTTGQHNAKKDMMLLEVFRRWGVEAGDDNQADAVALAEVGRAYAGLAIELTDFQKQAIKRVSKLGEPAPPKKPKKPRESAAAAA